MTANYAVNEVITTARLPMETRNKLLALARIKNKTKSEIIIQSLEMYYEREEGDMDSFSLGENVFGKYGSGDGDRSVTYKERIKKKLSNRKNDC
ncbi:CopG family ribbon-helix-helix protein [Treponema sp. R6D11]